MVVRFYLIKKIHIKAFYIKNFSLALKGLIKIILRKKKLNLQILTFLLIKILYLLYVFAMYKKLNNKNLKINKKLKFYHFLIIQMEFYRLKLKIPHSK